MSSLPWRPLLSCKTLSECVSRKNNIVVTLKNLVKKCFVIYSNIVHRPPLHTHAQFPTIIEPHLFKLLHELSVCEVSLIKVFFYYWQVTASGDLSEENISHSTIPLKLSYRPYLTLHAFLDLVRFTWVNNYTCSKSSNDVYYDVLLTETTNCVVDSLKR